MSVELENKLWAGKVDHASEWAKVADYLVNRLQEYIGHQVEVDGISPLDTSAFFCAIHGRSDRGPLSVAWRGFFGIESLHGGPLDALSLTVVPFVLGQRLKVGNSKSSTIELLFERRQEAPGQWTCQGWANDDYGEWEAVKPI